MLLHNLEIIDDPSVSDIYIKDGKVSAIDDIAGLPASEVVIRFDGAIAFPGLINSHDHLDFNLFPKLGKKMHNNYVEWSSHIHAYHKETINEVLYVPKQLRVMWGIYKNLISGVTTVVNHGPVLQTGNDILTVFQQYHLLHSIQLEKHWKYLLNKPFKKKWPFVIHIGEGRDNTSHDEIDYLKKWNLYKRDVIGVHGIAMTTDQASFFKALVWCPESNLFLIGKTAAVDKLKGTTDIMFGTDSTLSAGWNIWDHLRLARNMHLANDNELFNMLTTTPARIWGMQGSGKIENGKDADIVIARRKHGLHGYDAFYATDPEDILLILHKGSIRLFDASLLKQFDKDDALTGKFSKIVINGARKYVYGDLPGLIKQIRNYYKDASFPLEILEQNEAHSV